MAVPRESAIRVLGKIAGESLSLEEALQIERDGVSDAWLQDVCSGVLRWRGRIDRAIDLVALKKKPTGWTRRALAVAVYQLFAQSDAHPAGVVSETVNLIRKHEGEPPARFANALLRKISDHRTELAHPSWNPNASIEEQAKWASLPVWIWKRIREGHGEEWARAFAEASLERPRVWLRLAPGLPLPVWAEPGPVPGSAWISGITPTEIRQGYQAGQWMVQDVSNQMLIEEAHEIFRARNVQRVLDLCAAPGGKTIALSWLGYQLTASDGDSGRLQTMSANLKKVGVQAEVQTKENLASNFDAVWVDAPCMTTGLVRRHPDVRWSREEKDLKTLIPIQEKLLLEGWSRLRKGGVLIYSVCSVLPDEGSVLIQKVNLPQSIKLKRWHLAPHVHPHGDGFFAVMLEKN